MRPKLYFLIVSITLLLISPPGPASAGKTQKQPPAESTIERVLKSGVLRVGMSTFVPWAMKDKEGNLIGFEIDVAERLAKDIGVKVAFVPTKWDGIIPSLLAGKFDVIIGGMGITTQRSLKVNFTIPYDYTGMSMVAHKEPAEGFKGLEDFNNPEVVLVARLGATPVAAARKYMPRAELRQFDDESQAIQELLNGNAHALVASSPLPAFQALRHPDKLFLPLEEAFTREPIAFAVRKGDFDTVNFFNSWITVVESEGWLKERKHYWFETRQWEDRVQ
ncbi:MAG: transporter substrate-binding domain-containing protein [Thermodesulfobacteriota bacterium]